MVWEKLLLFRSSVQENGREFVRALTMYSRGYPKLIEKRQLLYPCYNNYSNSYADHYAKGFSDRQMEPPQGRGCCIVLLQSIRNQAGFLFIIR